MNGVRRLILILVSMILAIICAFPTMVMIIAIVIATYAKYISTFFSLIFAWNIGKIVESKYIKYLENKNGDKY